MQIYATTERHQERVTFNGNGTGFAELSLKPVIVKEIHEN